MNGTKTTALVACLTAGLAHAGDLTGTNCMPERIQHLMADAGYPLEPNRVLRPAQSTNSPGSWHFLAWGPFKPLVVPVTRPGWSLWNNSHFKYVGSNYDQFSLLAPSAALARYEYDISYSFYF